jgi:zinc protease
MKSVFLIPGRFIVTLTLVSLFAIPVKAGKITAKEFKVEGLKVILKQTPKDVISVRLFVEGGTANYPKAKEGIEDLAFSVAINGGTTTLDKLAFNNAYEKIGT